MQSVIESPHETLLEIKPFFPQSSQEGGLSKHLERGKEIFYRLLPESFAQYSLEKAQQWLKNELPSITWSQLDRTPECLSIFLFLSINQEIKAEKVLLEVIRKWLVPEKEVSILEFYNAYFYLPKLSSALFLVAELKIFIEGERELMLVKDHLPLLSNDLSLSLSSSKYFEKFLDMKALSLDQKSSQVQMFLRKLVQRTPKYFDVDLFREMSIFFAISHPDFRKLRLPKHISRILVSHYLMRKNLLHTLSIFPEKRHLEVHFVRSKLYFPFGVKAILGLSIAVGLTDSYEIFEDTHIIAAVQKFLPDAAVVQGSYYFNCANHDSIKCIYLELEKKNGSSFLQNEIYQLKINLKEELKKRIEKLIPSVFMIRNEEEVMRNILLLSQELKYVSDLPQVMINFDKQGQNELFFTVLVVRILKKHDLTLKDAFKNLSHPVRFIPDRVQNVGYIRKKRHKEANVFHICIPKDRTILRSDSSVNFYLARQKVISILIEALGEIRDYNGGMILKQGELFAQLRQVFIADNQQELLENFFFGLNPIEAQATLSLDSLTTLFKLCLESISKELPKRNSFFLKVIKRKNLVYVVLRTKDRSIEPILSDELVQLENFSKSLTQTKINFQGTLLQGLMYETHAQDQQKQFQSCLDRAIEKWIAKVANLQELHLSFLSIPLALDPRLGGDDVSGTLMKMLFEGLTRITKGTGPSLAIAKSIDISADQKRYTFHLRNSYWSNEMALVAHDFEYAWKKILSPSFYTPFAYFFYAIKNAKAAKEGKVDLDKIGVKAIDELTLVVDLEIPTPEFLELTAHALYSPINQKIENLHPNWAAQSGEELYVCNGPFRLKKSLPNGGYELIKNQNYWDKRAVKLNRVLITINNTEAAAEMFKNDELEWLGRPMHSWEPYFKISKDDEIAYSPLGVTLCIFNTQRFPFDNLKIRQAFKLATDRKKLAKYLGNKAKPTVTLLPPNHSSVNNESSFSTNKKLAIEFFEAALNELGLTRSSFPVLTLITSNKPAREFNKMLVKQWEDVFGISCRLEEYDFNVLFPKMIQGEFQLGMIGWRAWINDPTYTLNMFQFRTNKVNFSKWEHPQYQQLLSMAQKEVIPEKRTHYLMQAEMLLIEECPVLPICTVPYVALFKKRLRDAFISETGSVDFKYSSIVP